MSELGFWARFMLSVLAVWRVTHLLAREDGPWDLFYRLRRRLGQGVLGALMDCFQCLSLWVAAPFAFFVAESWSERAVAWLALSGAGCLLERLAEPRAALFPHREDSHAVLWSETDCPGERIPADRAHDGARSRPGA